jgi:hypothetical protein
MVRLLDGHRLRAMVIALVPLMGSLAVGTLGLDAPAMARSAAVPELAQESTCPCTLFGPDEAPVLADAGDATAVEVGVRFSADVTGYVSGVRFYKSAANTGTHVGNVWSAGGALLASATFTDESASGWQQVTFAHPVPIAAGGSYIASYHTDTGHYAADFGFFDLPVDAGPLHAPADGAQGNGVYRVGATGFPASSYRAANYWVDPVFVMTAQDTEAPTVIAQSPVPGATSVLPSATISAGFSEPVQPSTIQFSLSGPGGATVPVTFTYDAAASTATFAPSAPLPDGSYQAVVTAAKDLAGNQLAAPAAWTFDVGAPQCPCTLWPDSAVPANVDPGSGGAAEVGTRLSTDTAGYIIGVRFYKSAANVGTHVGHVWSSDGTLLGTVTFGSESPSGWQVAKLDNPVAVAPGTSYIVSYYAPAGHYSADNGYFALGGVDRRPLHAGQDCCGESNGVYRSGSSGFPGSSWASTNYWVDAVFAETAPDAVPPTVVFETPLPNATGVPVSSSVSVRFSEPVQASTVAFSLRSGTGQNVPGTTSYDPSTLTASFQPTSPLAATGSYTASVSGAKDMAGNTMQGTATWSFTPLGSTSLWGTPTPGIVDAGPSGPLELGTRFSASTNGYITGVRFYKSLANTGAHLAHLWTVGGQLLATATFAAESPSGWQQVLFDRPVPISAGGQYVVSYHTDVGHYSADPQYFATSGWRSGPLYAFQDGEGGGNGVFADGPPAYPVLTYGSANYWVDPVFTATAVDTTPPTVLSRGPNTGASGVAPQTLVTAGFDEPVSASSIKVTLRNAQGNAMAGTVSYDPPTRIVTFKPAAPLASGATYTAQVSGAVDLSGNAMGGTVTWSFTTAAAVPLQGTGGPILLVTNPADPYSQYYTEILRTEGLDLFSTMPLSSLTAAVLAQYDVVILAPAAVTSSQTTMLRSWVQNGGRLVGVRPDKSLASLFGLTATSATLSDAYLEINTAAAPGAGLTAQTIQYHGTADRYALNGATSVATLYSTSSAATTAPAVTVRKVGLGQAAAFTFDLARSVVQLRQGNPAWAGQHRLGMSPIRTTDLFFGNATDDPQPSWIDMTKVAIPQADVQQQLLANVITTMNATSKPLPRFAYLPNGNKAAVVLTGDDHAHGGTTGRFDQLLAQSPPGCSVAAWTCPRATSYVFPGTPISDAQAEQYTAAGFDIGVHVSTECNDFTDSELSEDFTEQFAAVAAQLPSIPSPVDNRTHCVPWSTWVGEVTSELAHGVRLDNNYYWWPPQLAANNPGLFTGSGMPMRFAASDGSLIDVYQAPTQITDESGQPEPSTINTLLDNATGPLGYYAVISVNAHTDSADSPTADAVVASAQAHGVPVISARQLVTWLDARDRSSFQSLKWSTGTLTFTIAADPSAVGLQTMLPATSLAAPFTAASPGTVRTITVNGSAVPFTIQSFKGLDYAVFAARPGTYRATYGNS